MSSRECSETSPSLRRRPPAGTCTGDARLANVEAEFEKLAMNPPERPKIGSRGLICESRSRTSFAHGGAGGDHHVDLQAERTEPPVTADHGSG